MTIAMLSLAGFPATGGFFGKIYLIEPPSTVTTPGSASSS